MKYFRRRTQSLKQNYLFGFLAIGLFLALPSLTLAAPGDLDSTFGNGGIVITADNPSFQVDYALGMAIQSDGKIVVVGEGTRNPPVALNWDFAVTRYNTNGTPDSSFGSNGTVITQLTSAYDGASAVAIQSDGKIIVVGNQFNCNFTLACFAVVRYKPNGSLDTSFNGTGIVNTSFTSSGGDTATSVAIQTDGKIVVAGYSRVGSNTNIALVRYNPNGSLDTTFGGTGKIITPDGGAESVTLQADGKIIVAGIKELIRYNTDVTLDTLFGGTGRVPLSFSVISAAIQADGKIVAAGGTNSNFAVARLNSNGSLDSSFGGTGQIIIPVGNNGSAADSLALQADGKIVVAGYASNNTDPDFAVVRLNPNGALDTTFGGTGKIITPIVNFGDDFVTGAAIQADGKIVVSGMTGSGDFYNWAVVRYEDGSNASIRTRFDFDGDGKSDISVFRPSNGDWYLLNSQSGFGGVQFGAATDRIVPADYDGDGRTDLAVYRDGNWFVQRSTLGFTNVQFGESNDIPIPADYDGDGKADIAVYRPSTGTWFLQRSQLGFTGIQFGTNGDLPVAADFDGDGKSDLAVFRPSNGIWYIFGSTQGFYGVQFGAEGDKLVPADYDGDGKTDIAVFRPSTATWYINRSQLGSTVVQFGISTDIPVPADYDGDGKADIGVYRNDTWFIQRSTAGFTGVQFGGAGDQPTPNSFVR